MKSFFRGRFAGYLYFGKKKKHQWMIADPADKELEDAMWALRYGTPSKAQIYKVLSAAEAYRHLCLYPIRGFARQQFSDICRAVKTPSDENWKPYDEKD